MERRAEITFAIFLFCSLAPLVSLAPTAASEGGKTTIGQRQKHYTTSIKPLLVLEKRATTLFRNYNGCSPMTETTKTWLTTDTQVNEMVKKIPTCPAAEADCCMHMFYNVLETLRSCIETICGKNFTAFVNLNTIQLNMTLLERGALHSCKNKDFLEGIHGDIQALRKAQQKIYIWRVLEIYDQFMQNTTRTYYSGEM